MRDLGIDHQAGRARRIPVMKQRMNKATQRRLKLRNLKIPALRVRLRLLGCGEPRSSTTLQNGTSPCAGQTTRASQWWHPRCHLRHPQQQIIIHHIRAMHQLLHAWPPERLPQLQQAWQATHDSLKSKQYPWYTVKGPMAATIAYMTEWGWDVRDLLHWTRPETNLLLANAAQLSEPSWKLEHVFYTEAKQQRTSRFGSSETSCQTSKTGTYMGSGCVALQRCNNHQTLSPVPRSGDTKTCAMVVQMAPRPEPQTPPS